MTLFSLAKESLLMYFLFMSAKDLRSWMEKNDKTPTDVASLAGVSLATVLRFLDGASVNRSTRRLLDTLLRDSASQPKKAVAV